MFVLCAIAALTVFSVATVQAARPASTVVVTPEDLAVPPDAFTVQESWYFYNDNTNTASTDESASQQFTFGPEDPAAGVGSVSFELPDAGARLNLATNQFAGTALAEIGALTFDMYTPSTSAGIETLFLNIDVDFDGSVDTNAYQGRLVYLPSNNGTLVDDEWQTWDAFDSGAVWIWSRFGSNGNMWPDGNTDPTRTLSEILTAFPKIEVWNDGATGQILIRAGHPGPAGLEGSVDRIVVGDVTFDFEPVNTVTDKADCMNGGWADFNNPVFTNPGDCIQFVNTGR
jgi:hypothetical protein